MLKVLIVEVAPKDKALEHIAHSIGTILEFRNRKA